MLEMMPRRQLGTNGPRVSAIGFGGAVLSPGYYEPVDDDTAIDTLRYALDQGITLIDTSDVYGLGHNERVIARAIAGRRAQVVLASLWSLRSCPLSAIKSSVSSRPTCG